MSEPVAPTPAADDQVHVWNPSGQLVKIPKAQLDQALAPTSGYSVATPEEIAGVQQAAQKTTATRGTYEAARAKGWDPVSSGLLAAVAPGGQAAAWREAGLEGATGGLGQAAVYEALGSLDPKWQKAYAKQLEALRGEYETTRVVGNIAGNIARDVTLGGVGLPSIAGAVEGKVAGQLGGLAAKGAFGRAAASGLAMAAGTGAESAVFGASQELSEEVLGDKQLAAEKILAAGGKQGVLGAAFGFGLGAGGSLLRSGARAAGESALGTLAKNADGLASHANEQRWRALDSIKKYATEAEAKLPGGVKDVGAALNEYGVTPKTYADAMRDGHPEAMLPKIAAAKDTVGKALGDIHAGSQAKVTWAQLEDATEKVIAPLRKGAGGEHIVQSLDAYKASLAEKLGVVSRDTEIPIQKVIEQRKFLDGLVWREGSPLNPSPRIEELRNIRRSMNEMTVEAIDGAAKKAGDVETGARLRKLARDYQALSIAEKAAESGAEKAINNRMLSPTSYVAAAGMLASGRPLAALGVAGGHQFVRDRGNAIAAIALDRLANIGQAHRAVQQANELMAKAAKGLTGLPYRGSVPASSAPLAKRYADAVKHVSAAQADVDGFTQRVTARAIPNAPETSAAMTLAASRTLAFLGAQMPRSMNRPTLGVPERDPRASTSEMTKFVRMYEAVQDPGAVLQRIAAGHVNRFEVYAIKNASPKMFEELQRRTLEEVAKAQASGRPLSHDQRMKLGIVLEIPTDPALEPGTKRRLQASLASDVGTKQNDSGRPEPSRPIDLKPAPMGLDRIEAR